MHPSQQKNTGRASYSAGTGKRLLKQRSLALLGFGAQYGNGRLVRVEAEIVLTSTGEKEDGVLE
jgi:hypothetical protein